MTLKPQENREHIEFLLSQYLDGQLDGRATSELERRLADDEELRDTLAELRRVDALVQQWGEQLPVVDAEAFVAEARLRREGASGSRRVVRLYRVLAPLAAAAAIGLVITGLFVLRAAPGESPDRGADVVAVSPPPQPVPTPPAASDSPPKQEVVVAISFSRGSGPMESESSVEPSRLLVTAGAVAAASDSAPIADEMPFF